MAAKTPKASKLQEYNLWQDYRAVPAIVNKLRRATDGGTDYLDGINGDGCDEFHTTLSIEQLIELYKKHNLLVKVKDNNIYIRIPNWEASDKKLHSQLVKIQAAEDAWFKEVEPTITSYNDEGQIDDSRYGDSV